MQDSSQNFKYPVYKQRMSTPIKIINSVIVLLIIGGFVGYFFYYNFVPLMIYQKDYFALGYSFIFIGLFFAVHYLLALINNVYYIPKIKKKADHLPFIGLQMIGMNQDPQTFTTTLLHFKSLTYPQELIRRFVLCIDGYKGENKMLNVFKEVFPHARDIELKQHFSSLPAEEKLKIIEQYRDETHLVITQPHGGRREANYTAFCFSTIDTQYVFHCDSDTFAGPQSVENMVKTAIGYNKSGKLCGAVIGSIQINNVFNYLAFQLEIIYWFSFFVGRASQSFFGGVTTVSGALALYQSQLIREIAQQYRQEYICKCLRVSLGQDRFLTSRLTQKGTSILFDPVAYARTQTPLTYNRLILQQTGWFISFYRQNLFSALKFYEYDFWAILNLTYSYFIPFLVLINIFYIVFLDINTMALFFLYVFLTCSFQSLIIILFTGKLRYFHSVASPILFYFIMQPSLIWPFIATTICIPDNDNEGPRKMWRKVFHAYVWIIVSLPVIIGLGIFYNLLVQREHLVFYYGVGLMILAGILFLLMVHWMVWGWSYLIPKNKEQMRQTLNRKYTQLSGSSRFIKAQIKL